MKTRRNIFLDGNRVDAFWYAVLIAFLGTALGSIAVGLWLIYHA